MTACQAGRQKNCGRKFLTLKTLTWQLEEWTCSMYSPCSSVVKVSTWIRKGTPFSPPCFLGVNSVLMQLTWGDEVKCVACVVFTPNPNFWLESTTTWMKTEAFLTGSQRNSIVLRCRGCEQGSSIPTDNGISANESTICQKHLRLWMEAEFWLMLWPETTCFCLLIQFLSTGWSVQLINCWDEIFCKFSFSCR